MYIHRTLEKSIKKLSKQFKVLLVTGARQVGKSTLLKHCDSERNYVTLDDYKAREMALNDPELFLLSGHNCLNALRYVLQACRIFTGQVVLKPPS